MKNSKGVSSSDHFGSLICDLIGAGAGLIAVSETVATGTEEEVGRLAKIADTRLCLQ